LVAPQQRDIGHILIIVPRAVGSAPERNKIRRQIKSIVYEHKLYERGIDCIAIVKKEAKALTFDQLKELVLQAYEKSNK
jgi:ribonuclease P protein component